MRLSAPLTPGVVQDVHQVAFNEIASRFNNSLDELGAAAGNASEKSAAIKNRVVSHLDEMRTAERSAWDDATSTMPNVKAKMPNGNAAIQGERSAGVPPAQR